MTASQLVLISSLFAVAASIRRSRVITGTTDEGDFQVLAPTKTDLKPVGVIMNPGGTVSPNLYNEALKGWIAEAEKQNMSMWVCTMAYWFDLSLPFRLEQNVKEAKKLMAEAGLPANADFIFTGHSMGASASMPDQNSLYEKGEWKAVVLQAGYITREFYPPMSKEFTYTAPTLTIGAELNYGFSRIPRFAEAMYRNRDFCDTHPVVMIEGMNHMQFATGFYKEDLKPEKPTAECQKEVAQLAVDFIAQQINGGSGGLVQEAKQSAKKLLQPFVDAFELEGSRSFNAPNQVDTTNYDCPRGICEADCEWAKMAQEELLGDAVLKKFKVKANFADLYPWRLWVDREPRKPFLEDGLVQAYAFAPYDVKTWEGDRITPISNPELAVKMVSRQRGLMAIGEDYSEMDEDFCVKFNQKAYDTALSMAGEKQRKRFKEFGTPLEFLPTDYKTAGPLWYGGALKWVRNRTSGTMTVRSTGLLTPVGERLIDGNHYCKLITPAQALEYIYLDGLGDQLLGEWD